jgi:hypothetical protein
MTSTPPLSPYDWQVERQRPDFRPEFPISGFGPSGGYTLWSVNPAGGSKLVIRNGRPTHIEVPHVLSTPAIRDLRNALIASLDADRIEDRISVSTKVYEYAAAILLLNYNLTDEDLTFLLADSTRWIKDVIHHACGGPDIIDQMCALSPHMLMKFLGESALPSFPPPPPAPASGKSLWRFFRHRLWPWGR